MSRWTTVYLFLFQAHGLIIRWIFPPVKFSLQESNISSPGGSWMENGLKKRRKFRSCGERSGSFPACKKGDTLSYTNKDGTKGSFTVSGILTGGGEEDGEIIAYLPTVQKALGLEGKVDTVTVSAMTTPENELARRAAANPKSLSIKEYEIWYCTSYVSSIAYQIEEVIHGSVARPVRQIAESEGRILDKTQLLMLLITVLSLLSATMGVSNLVSANIMERSRELGLLKALGATDVSVIILVLSEILWQVWRVVS